MNPTSWTERMVNKKTLPWWLLLFLVIALPVVVTDLHVSSFSKGFILEDLISPFDPNSDQVPVALVLGASVYRDGTLSPILEERAKTAIELYKNGLAKKIIVSGDNHDHSYNEVMPIRKYLMDNGVLAEDIFVDFAGFDTYDSMYRASSIFGAKDVFVVTQRFHLPRALYAARKVGLNAYGVPAGGSNAGVKNNVREALASVKTFAEVYLEARPYFLGKQIPIEGDGEESLR